MVGLTRSEIMSRIRSKGTRQERGFQLKVPGAVPHPDWLPFRPDFLLPGIRKAVFLDSDFWHLTGVKASSFDRMSDFWQAKLIRNYCRDLARDSFYPEEFVLVLDGAVFISASRANGVEGAGQA